MRRIVCALLVVITMTIGQSPEIFLSDFNASKSSESQLNIIFSNGPDENQHVKGLYTLSFASTGSGTISSIEVEISSDGSNWASIANLTSTPWLKHVDTTQYTKTEHTPSEQGHGIQMREISLCGVVADSSTLSTKYQ